MIINLDKPILATRFGRVHQSGGFWHSGRILPNYLLVHLISGDACMEFFGKRYEFRAGDILIIPKDTPYRPLESNGCTYYFFHFTATEAESGSGEITVESTPELPEDDYAYSYLCRTEPAVTVDLLTAPAASPGVNSVFERSALLDVVRNSSEKYLLDSLLRELLILISREYRKTETMNPTLKKMLLFVRENYRNNISLPDIAAAFDVSQSYVARLFRTGLSMRPSDYINKVRLAAACDLLVNTRLTVGIISDETGYRSQYYFSRIFKKEFGISPVFFRNAPMPPKTPM